MIESFAIDVYTWVLGTDIWITFATYILVFSILFNCINTVIASLAIIFSWIGIKINQREFLKKMREYNLLHARSTSILAVIGTFLGLSMAFYTLGINPELPTEAIKTMLVQMQYVFVSSLFGYFLGAFWSGIIIDFMLKQLLPKTKQQVEIIQRTVNQFETDLVAKKRQLTKRETVNLLKNHAVKLYPCKSK